MKQVSILFALVIFASHAADGPSIIFRPELPDCFAEKVPITGSVDFVTDDSCKNFPTANLKIVVTGTQKSKDKKQPVIIKSVTIDAGSGFAVADQAFAIPNVFMPTDKEWGNVEVTAVGYSDDEKCATVTDSVKVVKCSVKVVDFTVRHAGKALPGVATACNFDIKGTTTPKEGFVNYTFSQTGGLQLNGVPALLVNVTKGDFRSRFAVNVVPDQFDPTKTVDDGTVSVTAIFEPNDPDCLSGAKCMSEPFVSKVK